MMRGSLSALCLCAASFGLALGGLEAALVFAVDRELFLSRAELLRFVRAAVLCAAGVTVVCSLVLAGLGLAARRTARGSDELLGKRLGVATALLGLPCAAWLFWALSAGRRVRDLPARPFLVAALALVSALALAWLARRVVLLVAREDRRARVRAVGLSFFVAALALAADGLVLRRLYPALHHAFALVAVFGSALCAVLLPKPVLRAPYAQLLLFGVLFLLGAVPFALGDLARAPNAGFVVEQTAPLTGKWLRLWAARRPATPVARTSEPSASKSAVATRDSHAGVDLRGQDVLLITVDALRADRLAAYGGRGITPALDALAEGAVVFERAYTPTPHTSYAIGSLLTGKYLRPLFALSDGASREHATLPRMLRHHGYRTAAFYPPAIFFVDGERFAKLRADHFGFEYVKEMFAPASERVEQLAHYLEQARSGHPVFVWVHLFEPHEPYDPPEEFRGGDGPEGLYDGEVRAADAAAGELASLFRAARPRSTVIVTADHGEEFGDHGGYYHGTTLFEEQVRVPLLWSSPAALAPRRVSAPVELVDIATTLLSALGVPRDARMRGDDLGGVLLGSDAGFALRAFSSTERLTMWSDGRHKIICDLSVASGGCRLFDLERDAGESRSWSVEYPGVLQKLEAELSEFIASLPRHEALAMQGGAGWPKALSRARLGDLSAGPEVLPLLGAERAEVRAEAVRAVHLLGLGQARQVVSTLRVSDPDPKVRDEAAVTALALGDEGALEQAREVLARAVGEGPAGTALARKAALTVGAQRDEAAVAVLLALAADADAEEAERVRALSALALSAERQTVPPLVKLLDDVRLRSEVVRTLAAIGGKAAAGAVARAFARERYADARAAEAKALVNLRDARATPLILRFLGTPSGVPSGLFELLRAGGPKASASGFVLDLRSSGSQRAGGVLESAGARAVLEGGWSCDEPLGGCYPGADAALVLARGRAPEVPARAVAAVRAAGQGEWIELAGQRVTLRHGESDVSVALERARGARRVSFSASPSVRVLALALVPQTEEIAPPAPVLYDSGESELGADEAEGAPTATRPLR